MTRLEPNSDYIQEVSMQKKKLFRKWQYNNFPSKIPLKFLDW